MTGIERLRKVEATFEGLDSIVHYDGEPLREGETVWDVETGREYVVVEPSYGKTVVVRLAKYDDAEGEQHASDHLTHERPDSLEQFERDCDAISEAEGDEGSLYSALADYCARRGLLGDDHISLVARDLARRALALEGRV